jgi:hypothetical protein
MHYDFQDIPSSFVFTINGEFNKNAGAIAVIIKRNRGVIVVVCAVVASWLGGCSTLPPTSELPDATKLLQEGQAALDLGQKEKGLALLSSAAKANPGSADAWVKIAQTQFDAENYPAAIVAADEAQKRDPQRKETKAIAVVASLRVAVRALTDMREDSNLRGNTRSEAERLARMLRETLGQDVLVPVPTAEEARSISARRAAAATPSAAPSVSQAMPSPSATNRGTGSSNGATRASRKGPDRPTLKVRAPSGTSGTDGKGGGNPFSVLK